VIPYCNPVALRWGFYEELYLPLYTKKICKVQKNKKVTKRRTCEL